MQEHTMLLITLSRAVFLTTNILLLYVFLTSKRSLLFQIIAFSTTFVTVYFLRDMLQPVIPEPFLLGYMLGSLYIIPCALIFKETVHAKLFVFL